MSSYTIAELPGLFDQTGRVVGFVDQNGAEQLFEASVSGAGTIGRAVQKVGGKPVEDVTLRNTVQMQSQAWRIPARISGFRLGFEAISSTDLPPISLAKFAVTGVAGNNATQAMDAASDYHLGTIRNVTWGGAAGFTPPARRGANRASSIVWTDWMYCEAEAGQTLVYRQLVPYVADWRMTTFPHGFIARANYLAAVLNPSMANSVGADWLTANNSWGINSKNMHGNLYVPYVEWTFADSAVLGVWQFGDSTSHGSVDSGEPAVPPVISACEQISNSNVRLIPLTGSLPGLTTWEHFQRFEDLVAGIAPRERPHIIVWHIGSQNNQSTTSAITIQKGLLAAVRQWCKNHNVALVLQTQIPANGTALAVDNARKALNDHARGLNEIVADWDAVVSDGATPSAYKPIYGTGSHPFAAAYSDYVDQQLVPALRSACARFGVTV